MGRSCYSAFSQTSVPQLDPEEAAASDAAKRMAERSTAAKRQFRDDSSMHARKRATALWLAHFRYKLLVPGTQVDQMKTMHTTMNATACEDVMKEIETLLDGRLPRKDLMQIDRVVKRHFDPYADLCGQRSRRRRTCRRSFLCPSTSGAPFRRVERRTCMTPCWTSRFYR